MPHKVLSLDLASNVGFAVGNPGGEPDFGSHTLPSTGEDVGAYAYAFDVWLGSLILRHKPTTLVFCATILPRKMATSVQTQRKLQGLAWHAEFTAKRFELRCFEIYEATVRMIFTGSGAAKKEAVFERCHALGWDCRNQDESDALAAWAFACARFDPVNGAKFVTGKIKRER